MPYLFVLMYRTALITPGAKAALLTHVDAEPKRETGGILLGVQLDTDIVSITSASPPGPKAVKLPRYFSRDTRFLQRWLERRYGRSHGSQDYVGEWHVHHAIGVGPSCVDRSALFRIARKKNYPTANPVLLIAEDVPGERRLRAYGFELKPRKAMAELEIAVAEQ